MARLDHPLNGGESTSPLRIARHDLDLIAPELTEAEIDTLLDKLILGAVTCPECTPDLIVVGTIRLNNRVLIHRS